MNHVHPIFFKINYVDTGNEAPELLSIAMASAGGTYFYAECDDCIGRNVYNIADMDSVVNEYLKNMFLTETRYSNTNDHIMRENDYAMLVESLSTPQSIPPVVVYGNYETVVKKMKQWLLSTPGQLEFWGYNLGTRRDWEVFMYMWDNNPIDRVIQAPFDFMPYFKQIGMAWPVSRAAYVASEIDTKGEPIPDNALWEAVLNRFCYMKLFSTLMSNMNIAESARWKMVPDDPRIQSATLDMDDDTPVLSIEEWKNCVITNTLTDDDGVGYFMSAASEVVSTGQLVNPSDMYMFKIPEWVTGIAWFNK